MKYKKTVHLHPEKPLVTTAPEKPLSRILLDCVLAVLLLCGLLNCLVKMYGLPIAERLPLLFASGLCVLLQLSLHWRRGGFPVRLTLGVVWGVALIRNLPAVVTGALLLINCSLNTLTAASHGQFDFGYLAVSTAPGYTDAFCIQLCFLLLAALLVAVLAAAVHCRFALLCTLLVLALLTPALSMTVSPPTLGIVLLTGACAALFALGRRPRQFATLPAGSRRGWLALPAALLVAGILNGMLSPALYTRPQQLETLRSAFENAIGNLSPQHAHGGLANAVSRVDMRNTASVSFSGKTMLRVTTKAKEAQYLKTFCGTNYQDSTWSLSDGKAYESFLNSSTLKGNPYLQNNVQALMSLYEGLKRTKYGLSPQADSQITIENVAANSRCIYLPYGLSSLPEGARYQNDLNARFFNLFSKNVYTIPFYSCSDERDPGSYSTAGEVPSYSAGSWPVLSPGFLSNLIFTGKEGASFYPEDLSLNGENFLFAWKNISTLTSLQREVMKLYSAQTAYSSCAFQSGSQYTYTDSSGAGYLLTQQDVSLILQEITNRSDKLNALFRGLDRKTFLSRLQTFPTMSLKQFYTQPLCPLTRKDGKVVQDTSNPVSLKSINSDVGNFLEYEFQYRKAVYSENTQVPDSLRPKLVTWLKARGLNPDSTASLGSDQEYSAVSVVVNHVMQALSSSCQYTLSPGAPPAGMDFVDYFLNQNHYGYCVHFASAAVLLLRTLGIPARYAEGYYISGSQLNGRGETIDVTDNQAHAWVEVYSPGRGWIPFEATPGFTTLSTQDNLASYATPSHSAQASTASSSQASSSAASSQNSSESTAVSHQSAAAVSGATTESPADSSDTDLLFPLVCMAALLAAVLLLRHAWNLTRRRKAFSQMDTKAAGAAVYAYLQSLSAYGVPVSDEAHRLGEKALFSRSGLTPAEMQRLRTLADDAAQQVLAKHGVWGRFALRWLENIVPAVTGKGKHPPAKP